MAKRRSDQSAGRIAFRLGLSGAIALALLFVGAWTAGQLPIEATSLFVQLFSSAPASSVDALAEGVAFAALIGFFGAAFASLAYSAITSLEQKGASRRRRGKRTSPVGR